MPTAADAAETIQLHQAVFADVGLQNALDRVVGMVTQPGVEFADSNIHEYDPEQAAHLTRFIERADGLVFEAHSTDYHTPEAPKALVRDHFAILKVGPGLTFAYREGVYALSFIEDELFGRTASGIRDVIDQVILKHPETWAPYSSWIESEISFARRYSFSDRSRYLWPNSRIVDAMDRMLENLSSVEIPWSLLSQYAPDQYREIRSGVLKFEQEEILIGKVTEVLDDYLMATAG